VETLLACFYGGLIAVPLYALSGHRRVERAGGVVRDCGARLVMTDHELTYLRLSDLGIETAEVLLFSDHLPIEDHHTLDAPRVDSASAAYLQYTSGSTGRPKGVIISHANLLANLRALGNVFAGRGEDVLVNWLPLFHDLGLVFSALLPIYLGAHSVLMNASEFVQCPLFWLETITRYRGTMAAAPNFAYGLCVESAAKQGCVGLDLSTWELALNGAEIVHAKTLESFAQTFAAAGFRRSSFLPAYGMAEATLVLTAGGRQQGPILREVDAGGLRADHARLDGRSRDMSALVGCGRELPGHRIRIVDPQTCQELEAGKVGEIWASGPSIGRGYWNDTSNPIFGARLQGSEERWLRTGDLGLMLDRELFITGRIKDLIIIRGENHSAAEIEWTVYESHGALRLGGGAAFSVSGDIGEELVIVSELTRDGVREREYRKVHEAIREALAHQHGLSARTIVLIRPGGIPKTTSGKIQRSLCRDKLLNGELAVIDRYDHRSTRVVSEPGQASLGVILSEILAGLLGTDIVSPTTTFWSLAVDSLVLAQLVARINERFATALHIEEVFENPTLGGLQALLERKGVSRPGRRLPPPHPRRAGAAYYGELSRGQQRLLYLSHLEGPSPTYNIHMAFRLKGALNVEALRRSLDELVARHESLRTRFVDQDGGAKCVVSAHEILRVPVFDFSGHGVDTAEACAEFLRREALSWFDLSEAPLIRASLLRLGPVEHVFQINVHHIVADGWSIRVILEELSVLYARHDGQLDARALGIPRGYLDYVAYEAQTLTADLIGRQLAYWRRKLHNLSALKLRTDRPRVQASKHRGAVVDLLLPKTPMERLTQIGISAEATVFMVCLAAFKLLLSRETGQGDVAIGSVFANRPASELEAVVGFFVNTIVLRTSVDPEADFFDYLRAVRATCIEAYANQNAPFDQVVDCINPGRYLSANPLFQVMFAFQPDPGVLKLSDMEVTPLRQTGGVARFDLFVSLTREADGVAAAFEYDLDLFEARTIQDLADRYQHLLASIASDPLRKVCEIGCTPLTAGAARQQLPKVPAEPEEVIGLAPSSQDGLSIVDLFECQVRERGGKCALIGGQERVSYEELNGRANQLAHCLRECGVSQEDRVGLLLERSVEAIVGMLAVLKAGGAYVPLEREYPAKRIGELLQQSRPKVLIHRGELPAGLQFEGGRIELQSEGQRIARMPLQDPGISRSAEQLAYVMFTSGSSGEPKGVEIADRGVVRLVSAAGVIRYGPEEVLLQHSSLSFDASTFEIYAALLHGGSLVIAPAGVVGFEELRAVIGRYAVTTLWLTAGYFHALVQEKPEALDGIRQLLAGGDVVSGERVRRLRQYREERGAGLALINGYGPTENTTFTCCHEVAGELAAGSSVPIGQPIPKTQVYILDSDLNPVPMGVVGELYAGGAGLARGYLNDARLTAQKFLPNPFSGKPGERLYRTGDLVRCLADGQIEFLRRVDQQVKIRGYRVELGEIEARLRQHPQVHDAVVCARGQEGGEKQLVAYVVGELEGLPAADGEIAREQLLDWQNIYETLYGGQQEGGLVAQAAYEDFVGWNSSYTDQPIAREQMEQWLQQTCERISGVGPQQVLEIGCGTGLLLWRLAPRCVSYTGTDFSRAVLQRLSHELARQGGALSQVQLQQRSADNFEGIPEGAFDTVILNSVIQYFPSLEYLRAVIRGALRALRPGGSLFIGDIRNHALLESFHGSVAAYKAAAGSSVGSLKEAVQRRIDQEKELTIDPEFFLALCTLEPGLQDVQILPKCAAYENELSKYRYDVIIRVASGRSAAAAPMPTVSWYDWQKDELSLQRLAGILEQQDGGVVGLTGVPDELLSRDLAIQQQLRTSPAGQSVQPLLEAAERQVSARGLLESIRCVAQTHSYRLQTSWIPCGSRGELTLLMSRQGCPEESVYRLLPGAHRRMRQWTQYANNPLRAQQTARLIAQLREHLQERLPQYMVPGEFVLLEQLPLTANGKADRAALSAAPQPPDARTAYAAPTTVKQKQLAEIWEDVLGVSPIGIHDNFFELGGDSILSIQIASRATKAGLNLSTRHILQSQTISDLAVVVDHADQRAIASSPMAGGIPLTPIQHWFFALELRHATAFSQCLVLEFAEGLEDTSLQAALQNVFIEWDSLRLRFSRASDRWAQHYAPDAGRISEIYSVLDTGLSLPDGAQAIEGIVREIHRGVCLETGPLIKVVRANYLQTVAFHLVIGVHHVAIDGVSWHLVLDRLTRELAGSPRAHVKIPQPTALRFGSWAHWMTSQVRSGALDAEVSYWKGVLDEPLVRVPVDHDVMNSPESATDFVTATLGQQQTEALLRSEGRTAIRPFEILVAALTTTLAEWVGEGDLLIRMEGNGRSARAVSPLEVADAIGWYTAIYPLRLNVAASRINAMSAAQILNTTKTQIRGVPNEGINFGALRYIGNRFEACTRALEFLDHRSLNFNYLGQFRSASSSGAAFRPLPQTLRLIQHPENTRTGLLGLTCLVIDGVLQIQWDYSRSVHGEGTLRKLSGSFLEKLRLLIAHCMAGSAVSRAPADFPLASLTARELERLESEHSDITAVYAASPMQDAFLFQHVHNPDHTVNVVQLEIGVGSDNVLRFIDAWKRVVFTHCVFSTTFEWNIAGGAVQIVHQHPIFEITEHDWRAMRPDELEAEFELLRVRDRERGFDPRQLPLTRLNAIAVDGPRARILWTLHHLVIDGWSLGVLLREIVQEYVRPGHRKTASASYANYLAWLRDRDRRADLQFWRSYLQGFRAKTPLFGGTRAVQEPTRQREHVSVGVSGKETRQLAQFARANHVTVSAILSAAWALVLSRYCGLEEVVFGLTVSGRPERLEKVDEMVGVFINTLPLRLRVRSEATVLDWLRETFESLRRVNEHCHVPLSEIRRVSEMRNADGLFDSILVLENYPHLTVEGGTESDIVVDYNGADRSGYPVSMIVMSGEQMSARLSYDKGDFGEQLMDEVAAQFRQTITGLVSDPRRPMLELFEDQHGWLPGVVNQTAPRRQRCSTP
jgi:amino acid adenylation domain-containing protein/non-ribosomal peptide synthase protein (TIGR01720 family)